MNIDLSGLAYRIADLEKSGSLVETTAQLLVHAYNDISNDLEALKMKIEKFNSRITAVEYDCSRTHLIAKAQEHFDRLINEIKAAADDDALEYPRQKVEDLKWT